MSANKQNHNNNDAQRVALQGAMKGACASS